MITSTWSLNDITPELKALSRIKQSTELEALCKQSSKRSLIFFSSTVVLHELEQLTVELTKLFFVAQRNRAL